jgi:hypothetical protein
MSPAAQTGRRYIVIRPAPDLPDGFLPPYWNGRWIDLTDVPIGRPKGLQVTGKVVAVATGRFETGARDGAEAGVYEVRPA